MNWLIFALASYLFLVLQTSLGSLLTIDHASPDFMLILLVFVGLCAPSRVLAWTALIIGLLVDLQPGPLAVPIIGPAVLGYLAGAYVLVQLRGLVFRESVITFAALVLIVGIAVQLVMVAIYTLRGFPWPLAEPVPGWVATDQLVQRFFVLIYSMVLAVPLGWLLLRTSSLWSFPGKARQQRHF